MKECITHHRACDCREAELAAVTAERDDLLRRREATDKWASSMVDRVEAAEAKLEKVREWRNDNLDYVCSCSEAYTRRNLIDGDCQWHDIEIPALDAILAPGGGEIG